MNPQRRWRLKALLQSASRFRVRCPTLVLLLGLLIPARAVAEPATAGYRDFHYGEAVGGSPTGEKPESKPWWNDSFWWGSLWDTTSSRYEIHRFDPVAQRWSSTHTRIDERWASKADALWDGRHLYVVSHGVAGVPGLSGSANAGRLYRFSYDPDASCYRLDSGFPVLVSDTRSETLVLDKDSTGKLWVTWVRNGKVKLNRSLGDDRTWGAPFDLPVQGTDTSSDDISSIISFGGDKVGVMWSNQIDQKTYFAVHRDGNPDELWEPLETALADSDPGAMSDDHLNLKAHDGSVYAVTKTSLDRAESPCVLLLRRDPAGAWSRHLVGTKRDNHSHPILLIDADRDSAHVVAMSNRSGRNVIYMKSASLADRVFPEGFGTPFIDSPADSHAHNPTFT